MRDPNTAREYAALDLASRHAATTTMPFVEQVRWACENWPDFMDQATEEVVQAHEEEGKKMLDDFDAFTAYSEVIAGPCPEDEQGQEEWLVRLREAEKSLRAKAMPPEGASDEEWAKFWKNNAPDTWEWDEEE